MRRGKFLCFALLFLPLSLLAQGPERFVAALRALGPGSVRVDYAVTLPQAEDDVTYDVTLTQAPNGWIIDWQSGDRVGWSASFGGHFYNFRNDRLQELHSGWDAATAPKAQFQELLPANMADVLAGFSDAKITGSSVKYVTEICGEVASEQQWDFRADGSPLAYHADNNPGQFTAMQIAAKFAEYEPATVDSLSEEMLRVRYPRAFEECRESQFAVEQMRGKQLPEFSLPRADGEGRVGHSLKAPTVLVMMEAESDLAAELVAQIRSAMDRLPFNADVIWALAERNLDATQELFTREDTVCLGCKGLARKCGVAALPTILVCAPDGTVAEVLIGLNNDTSSRVIQALTHVIKS